MSNNGSQNKNKKLQSLICSICQFPWSNHSHHGQFQASNIEHRVGKRCTQSVLRAKLFLTRHQSEAMGHYLIGLSRCLNPSLRAENYERAVATVLCSIPHVFQDARTQIFYCAKELELGSRKPAVNHTALAAQKGKQQPRAGKNFYKGTQQSGISIGGWSSGFLIVNPVVFAL